MVVSYEQKGEVLTPLFIDSIMLVFPGKANLYILAMINQLVLTCSGKTKHLSFIVFVFSSTTWKSQFEDRNLIAFSASPLLIHPTHYTGQEGYISDTEGSMIHSTPPINPMQHDKQKPKRVILGTFIGFKEEDDSLNIESRFVDPENTPDSWSESLTQKFYKTEL